MKNYVDVKTIRGFIGLLERVAHADVEQLREFDKLTFEQQRVLTGARAEAYNSIGEIKDFTESDNLKA